MKLLRHTLPKPVPKGQVKQQQNVALISNTDFNERIVRNAIYTFACRIASERGYGIDHEGFQIQNILSSSCFGRIYAEEVSDERH